PGRRSVAGVVVGHGRLAERPVEPVGEAADGDQERERHRDQRDGRDRRPVDDRIPAVGGTDRGGERDREAEGQRQAEQDAVPAGRAELRRHAHLPDSLLTVRRYSTSVSISAGESWLL